QNQVRFLQPARDLLADLGFQVLSVLYAVAAGVDEFDDDGRLTLHGGGELDNGPYAVARHSWSRVDDADEPAPREIARAGLADIRPADDADFWDPRAPPLAARFSFASHSVTASGSRAYTGNNPIAPANFPAIAISLPISQTTSLRETAVCGGSK